MPENTGVAAGVKPSSSTEANKRGGAGASPATPPARENFLFGVATIMPFRIFLVPVLYGDDVTGELNAFIASHRVAHIERQWIDHGSQSAWAFCVDYVVATPIHDGLPRSQLNRNRIDYKTILTPDEFTIFSLLRELRKEFSQQEGVPVFALFSNEQLAQVVQWRFGNSGNAASIVDARQAHERTERLSKRCFVVVRRALDCTATPSNTPTRYMP